MKKRSAAIIAALCIASAMSAGAYAQGPVGDVADGIGDAAEGIGEGAGDIIEGVGDGIADAAEGIGEGAGDVLDGAGDTADGADEEDIVVNDGEEDEEIAEATDDDDVDDTVEDDEDDDEVEIFEADISKNSGSTANPATGVLPFMTTGLVAVTAAGVAYLTKKRNMENGQ